LRISVAQTETCLSEQPGEGARGQKRGARWGGQWSVGGKGNRERERAEKGQREKKRDREGMGVLMCLFDVTQIHSGRFTRQA